MGDVDAISRERGDLAGDLRERGFHPLPVRMHADFDFERAVRRQPHGGAVVTRNDRQPPGGEHRGAVCRLFTIGRETDAEVFALRTCLGLLGDKARVIKHLHHSRQARRVVAAVERFLRDVGVWHVATGDEVLEAHLDRITPNRARNRIHQHFHCESDSRARHAAIR